jgi:DNA primase
MAVDVQAIKDSNPLHAIVERFTGQQIEKHKISCPLHNDTTPSMHIYDDGGFKCFSCGVHGDVLDFVGYFYFGSQYDKTTHFTDVVDRLGGINIAPLPQRTVKPAPPPSKQQIISLDDVMNWHESMPPSRREYWIRRGLFDSTINEFMLGWDGKRYVIPHLYRLVPFGAKRRQSEISDGIDAKYTSVTGSRAGLFNADCLWSTDKVVICEGEIDAMLLTQAGFPAVSSTSGAGTFKEDWAKLFSHVNQIWIMYDNDEAGRKGELLVHASLRRAKIVRYPSAIKDCGELFERDAAAVGWLKERLV